jgi:2'-5' RNA ligase
MDILMYSLFVSLELPQPVKDQLSVLCNGLPGAMWLDVDQFHLTVRHIGRVDGGVFADVRDALATVKAEPVEIELDGVGFFPPKRHPQSLWVGVRKSEELTRLRSRVDSVLKNCELEPEGRKFSPHVTLAHFSGGNVRSDKPNHMAEYLARTSLFKTEPFVVDQFGLYSGARSNHGPIYRLESDYALI